MRVIRVDPATIHYYPTALILLSYFYCHHTFTIDGDSHFNMSFKRVSIEILSILNAGCKQVVSEQIFRIYKQCRGTPESRIVYTSCDNDFENLTVLFPLTLSVFYFYKKNDKNNRNFRIVFRFEVFRASPAT